jgi:hypothetical protein
LQQCKTAIFRIAGTDIDLRRRILHQFSHYVQRDEDDDDDFSDIQQKPHILWSLAEDDLYSDLKRPLVAIHQNPAGASGERNHKVGKRVHCRTRIRLGQQKIEAGTAIAFNGKQLDRRIGITRDEPFTNWLSGLGRP